jgi:hypothetical protein
VIATQWISRLKKLPNKVKVYETIIAVLLVCDWNLRVWTLLKSMRGRRKIYVLCKNENIVSLKEVLEVVHISGRIDVAVLAFTFQYLLPWRDQVDSSIPGYNQIFCLCLFLSKPQC